jgi:hypothetical protein
MQNIETSQQKDLRPFGRYQVSVLDDDRTDQLPTSRSSIQSLASIVGRVVIDWRLTRAYTPQ